MFCKLAVIILFGFYGPTTHGELDGRKEGSGWGEAEGEGCPPRQIWRIRNVKMSTN